LAFTLGHVFILCPQFKMQGLLTADGAVALIDGCTCHQGRVIDWNILCWQDAPHTFMDHFCEVPP